MKNKIFFVVVAIVLIIAFIFTFKDTYSYYIDTNNLSLVSSKIGKFGGIEKSDIKKDAGTQLQDNPVGGLYRYKGRTWEVINNYICFGTNNKSTCLNNLETYMYRIIGITDNSSINSDLGILENSLKIIKAAPYNNETPWNNSTDDSWDAASVNTTLNTSFLETIQPDWQNKISNHKWCMTKNNSYPTIDSGEPCTSTTKNTTKIGLMYASDYYNAVDYSYLKDGWLLIINRWSSGLGRYDWTMSVYTGSWDGVRAFFANGDSGYIDTRPLTSNFSISPVFYLIPEISLTGTGASDDPYLIS